MLCVFVALGLEARGRMPVQVERTSLLLTFRLRMSPKDSSMKAICEQDKRYKAVRGEGLGIKQVKL
jgi:hypothetical protein